MQLGMTRLIVASAALALTTGSASAETVIYQDNFIGHADVGADGLNGETPDIGTNNWVASTSYSADGSVANSIGASATLAFTPVDGLVYTLDASFRDFADSGATTPDNDWLALGFSAGQSTTTSINSRFVDGGSPRGRAWILMRGASTANANNVAWLGTAGDGTPSTAGASAAWSDGTLAASYAADLDLRVVLDTTDGAGNWTATWYAKAAADSEYTLVRAEADLLSEDITSVGIARSETGFTAKVTAFSLTSIPEPSSLALMGLGGLLIARRRRGA